MKITPKPKFKKQGVDFAELKIKDWFIYNDRLCMKTSDNQMGGTQSALDTSDGQHFMDMCGEYVLPVGVEIKWKRKEILR